MRTGPPINHDKHFSGILLGPVVEHLNSVRWSTSTMQSRHMVFLILGIACMASIGCCGCLQNSCPYGGQACCDECASCGCPEASCCCPNAACGCPEASYCCPDASCGCPEASCCCPDSCSTGVGCGSPVVGQCRLLRRIKNALCGCYGCGGERYYGDGSISMPCDCYGNSEGGFQHSPPMVSGPTVAGRRRNLNRALELADEGEPTYR